MLKRIACLSAILFLGSLPCVPEIEWRSVAGVVTDKRGNALPGAEVQLEDSVLLSVRSYITRGDGRYHFSRVNANIDYTLKAKYREYWSKPKTLSQFNSAEHARVDLVIPTE